MNRRKEEPFATALKYDKDKNKAPVIVAKGKGKLAEKIKAIAKENNIPIIENKGLTEVLDKLEIYEEIPPELYKVVAHIFAFIYKLNNKL
ncbi:MAG: flagellar biosynthesis protein FlhB [Candidatus Acididesulfobacter guangdongensis]|uniref:Flagellar biosynthesis protein FlhB n=1 Tax=Acididesulfobacter guangdongensis TaxID=2597225 RepID=A0A519BG04_ACIG2|nr:MAG: flagellar biosynthesis protein FlhB [Candidatus Acididesulfobacter guangdongensis]